MGYYLMSDPCTPAPRPLKLCNEPSPPILACSNTIIFGAPMRTMGRVPPTPAPQVETPILAIAIHCLKDDYQGYLSKACVASPNLMPCEHASMHYVVDALTGQISCLVKETDVAWAFQSYLSNFPMPNPLQPYPGWPELSAIYPALSADFYTINIGLAVPSQPQNEVLDGDTCCLGPYGLTWKAYANLVQLIAWIANRYDIPLDKEHIAFHDDIVETAYGCEECTCRNLVCFICDVSSYCESCKNVGDPTYTLFDDIAFVYGETAGGCRVKISIEDLRSLINA
jgi:hypothetical protein